MRHARSVILALLAAAVAFGAITLLALEGKEIAILHTTGPGGGERSTRVWFAEHEGSLWVEAATTSRPFYVDLEAEPGVVLELRPSPFASRAAAVKGRAELVPEPGGHEKVRALLSGKYGWADGWIGLLQDTSASRAVRIVQEGSGPADGG